MVPKIIYLSLLTLALHFESSSQQPTNFPVGVTIDPAIQKICESKKDINSFTLNPFINDTLVKNGIFSGHMRWPLNSIVTINKKDTSITFINMIFPVGFQIRFANDSCNVETFISSKSCKCFKNTLTDTQLSYGAGAAPELLTLVLSKRYALKKGDKIFGYIKTLGGNTYHFPNEGTDFYKERFEYEGYFVITFTPIGD